MARGDVRQIPQAAPRRAPGAIRPPGFRRSSLAASAVFPAAAAARSQAAADAALVAGAGAGSPVAQALAAMRLTAPDDKHAHALHLFYQRPGLTDQPLLFAVERDADGGRAPSVAQQPACICRQGFAPCWSPAIATDRAVCERRPRSPSQRPEQGRATAAARRQKNGDAAAYRMMSMGMITCTLLVKY